MYIFINPATIYTVRAMSRNHKHQQWTLPKIRNRDVQNHKVICKIDPAFLYCINAVAESYYKYSLQGVKINLIEYILRQNICLLLII